MLLACEEIGDALGELVTGGGGDRVGPSTFRTWNPPGPGASAGTVGGELGSTGGGLGAGPFTSRTWKLDWLGGDPDGGVTDGGGVLYEDVDTWPALLRSG